MNFVNHINFFSNAKMPFCKLSNFSHIKDGIIVNDITYASTEHAFQAQKYIKDDRWRFGLDGDLGSWEGFGLVSKKSSDYWKKKDNIGIIAKMATNKIKGKKLGLTRIFEFQSTDELWESILVKKFSIQEFGNVLRSTEDMYLLEFDRGAKRNGSKWGGLIEAETLYGENNMGKYLMKVREFILM